jgi:hypothetical protein
MLPVALETAKSRYCEYAAPNRLPTMAKEVMMWHGA